MCHVVWLAFGTLLFVTTSEAYNRFELVTSNESLGDSLFGHVLGLTEDGSTLMAAGGLINLLGDYHNTNELLNLSDWASADWYTTGSGLLNFSVEGQQYASLPNDNLVVVFDEAFKRLLILDTSAGIADANTSWTASAELEYGLVGACVTVDAANGLVFLVGTQEYELNTQVYIYDIHANTWTTDLESFNDLHENAQCHFEADSNEIHVFGGWDAANSAVQSSIVIYSATDDSWIASANELNIPRYGGHSVAIDGLVLLLSGLTSTSIYQTLSTTEVYNVSAQSVIGWGPSLQRSRAFAGVAFDESRRVLFVTGGVHRGMAADSWEFLDLNTAGTNGAAVTLQQLITDDAISRFYVVDESKFNDSNMADDNNNMDTLDGIRVDDFAEALQMARIHASAEVVFKTDCEVHAANWLYFDADTAAGFSLDISCDHFEKDGCNIVVYDSEAPGDASFLAIDGENNEAFEVTLAGDFSFESMSQDSGGILSWIGGRGNVTIDGIYAVLNGGMNAVHIVASGDTNSRLKLMNSAFEGLSQNGYYDTVLLATVSECVLDTIVAEHLMSYGNGIFDVRSERLYASHLSYAHMDTSFGLTTSGSAPLTVSESKSPVIDDVRCNMTWGGASCVWLSDTTEGNIQISNVQVTGDGPDYGTVGLYGNVGANVMDDAFADTILTVNGFYSKDTITGLHGSISNMGTAEQFTMNAQIVNNRMIVSNFGAGVSSKGKASHCVNCVLHNCHSATGGAFSIGTVEDKWSFVVDSTFTNNYGGKFGGAILLNSGYLSVQNCTLSGNEADQGAAVGCVMTDPSMVFESIASNYSHNIASSNGGAVYMFGGIYRIHDCLMFENVAKTSGGGLYDGDGAFVCRSYLSAVYDSTVVNNTAQQGAGLFIRGCNFTMEGCRLAENYASIFGGALMIDAASGKQRIANCSFEQNHAGRVGGGVALTGGNVRMQSVQITDNHAPDLGGGLFVRASTGWQLAALVLDSNITGNWAREGGGVSIVSGDNDYDFPNSEPLLRFVNTNIARNHASSNGGGIHLKLGFLRTEQCAISENRAAFGGGLNYEAGFYYDYESGFLGNEVSGDGGGLRALDTAFVLNGTRFDGNFATYGAAMFLKRCPANSSQNVSFSNNSAQNSGGAVQNGDAHCGNGWCEHCDYASNSAAFGADSASMAVNMSCVWREANSKIRRNSLLTPKCALYDAFGQRLAVFATTQLAKVTLFGEDLNFSGVTETNFDASNDGWAQFSFYLKPHKAIEHKNAKRSLTVWFTAETYAFTVAYDNVRFENVVWQTPAGTWVLSLLLGFTALASCVLVSVGIVQYSTQPIIRGANIPFLWVIVGGSLVTSAYIATAALAPQSVDCTSPLWLLHFGFLLITAPIAGKTYRIYVIFYTAKRAQLRDWNTLRLTVWFLAIPSAAMGLYLTVWTVLDPTKTKWETLNSGDVRQYCDYASAFWIVSAVVAVVSLCSLVYLSAAVRNVPRNFNESRWLGTATYTMSVTFLFVLPLTAMRTVSQPAKAVFAVVGCFVAMQSVLASIFGVKFYLIKTGKATVKKMDTVVSQTGGSAETTQDDIVSDFSRNPTLDSSFDSKALSLDSSANF